MRVQSVSVKGNNYYQSMGKIGFGITQPKAEKILSPVAKVLNSISKETPLVDLSMQKLTKKLASLKSRTTFEFEKYYNSISNPVTKNFTIKGDAEQKSICDILASRIKEVNKVIKDKQLQKVNKAELKKAVDFQEAA